MSITARIEAVKQLDAERACEAPPVPRSVKVELTSRCDFQCFFCAAHARPRKKADMDWPLFRRLARELRELGVEQLGLFYLGESFLAELLPEAIEFAKRECGFPYVFVTTNGHAATPERVEACVRAGLDSLKFAINFSRPEEFQEVTRLKPAGYRAVLHNLAAARAVRDRVAALTGHRCALYASSLSYGGEDEVPPGEALAQIEKQVDEHYWLPLYGDRTPEQGFGPGPRIDGLRKAVPCWSLFTEAHITWDGRLSACCLDHDRRFSMGDLTRELFVEAWHGEKFRALRRAHLGGNVKRTVCERCIGYA